MENIREPKEWLAQKLASSPKTLFSPSDIEDMFEELRPIWDWPKRYTVNSHAAAETITITLRQRPTAP